MLDPLSCKELNKPVNITTKSQNSTKNQRIVFRDDQGKHARMASKKLEPAFITEQPNILKNDSETVVSIEPAILETSLVPCI